MSNNPARSSKFQKAARARITLMLPSPCIHCHTLIHPGEEWAVGHRQAIALRPDLARKMWNVGPAHYPCEEEDSKVVAATLAALDTPVNNPYPMKPFPKKRTRKTKNHHGPDPLVAREAQMMYRTYNDIHVDWAGMLERAASIEHTYEHLTCYIQMVWNTRSEVLAERLTNKYFPQPVLPTYIIWKKTHTHE